MRDASQTQNTEQAGRKKKQRIPLMANAIFYSFLPSFFSPSFFSSPHLASPSISNDCITKAKQPSHQLCQLCCLEILQILAHPLDHWSISSPSTPAFSSPLLCRLSFSCELSNLYATHKKPSNSHTGQVDAAPALPSLFFTWKVPSYKVESKKNAPHRTKERP